VFTKCAFEHVWTLAFCHRFVRTFVCGEAQKLNDSLWLNSLSYEVGSASPYASKGSENVLSNSDPVTQNFLSRGTNHNSFWIHDIFWQFEQWECHYLEAANEAVSFERLKHCFIILLQVGISLAGSCLCHSSAYKCCHASQITHSQWQAGCLFIIRKISKSHRTLGSLW